MKMALHSDVGLGFWVVFCLVGSLVLFEVFWGEEEGMCFGFVIGFVLFCFFS